MKIYTKTGDKGTTGLLDGTRLPKSSIRVDTYGTVDELNSVIGIVSTLDVPETLMPAIDKLKHILFELGADLANPRKSNPGDNEIRIKTEYTGWLENLIDEYTSQMPTLKNFVIPGGTQVSAYLNNARTIARRAERLAVVLASQEDIGDDVIVFLNRLSDYLFTASRYANHLAGAKESIWKEKH